MELTLAYWENDKKELLSKREDLRRQNNLIDLHLREAQNQISVLLLEQSGLVRGDELLLTDGIMEPLGWHSQFKSGDRVFIDGMERSFGKLVVIVVDRIDGYSPFDDFNVSSSEYDKIASRLRIPITEIIAKMMG